MILALLEVSKGKGKAVLLFNSTIACLLQGLIKRGYLVGLTQGDGTGTKRGLDLVKVSLDSSILVLSIPLPVIILHPI